MRGLPIRAFDPRGRLSVAAYRRFVVRALLAFAGLVCLAIWLAALGFRTLAMLTFACNLVVMLALLARTARRLHDRDRSVAWLGVYGVVHAASLMPIEAAADRYPVAVVAGIVAMLGFFAWFFAETILRSGTVGANRFDPEP